jgi:A/G-specific adenine glycosylase
MVQTIARVRLSHGEQAGKLNATIRWANTKGKDAAMAKHHSRQTDQPLPDAKWARSFGRRLVGWFSQNARDLPWRRTRDPYAVWISEVMLQQTQVATVIPYFERFMQTLPTIEALAAADEEQVLRLWEGLGYYRRARQLHRAAQVIATEHGGSFPRDRDAVRRLPGIGRYTAGAVLSLAFDAREPILEANTARLLTRLLAYRGDPGSTAGTRLLWSAAEAVLPSARAGTFNQAMMELGSEVCVPRRPRCEDCPVALLCRARAEGIQGEIPLIQRRPPAEARREAAVLVRRRGRVLVLKQPDGKRWAGLWDFPRFPVAAENGSSLWNELADNVRRLTGAAIKPGRHCATLRHGVTRFRITLECFEAECVRCPAADRHSPTIRWLRPGELEGYPLSTTGRKLSRLLVAGDPG